MEDNRVHKNCKRLHDVKKFSNIKEMLLNTRKEYGDCDAFKYKTDKPGVFRTVSYNEYLDNVEALGTVLIDMGLKNKRIAVISENRCEWTTSYLATVTGVGIIVPLDKSLPEHEIESSIKRSEVEAIFYSKKYDEIMERIKEQDDNKLNYFISMDKEKEENGIYSFNELISKGKELLKQGNREYLDAEIDNEKMAVMLFTSGTTSMSKAVMLSHKNICTNLYDITSVFDVDKNDTFLSFLPLHHVFECTVGFLYPVSMGACSAYCEGIRHIADNIREFQISVMISVPLLFENMYQKLWKTIEKQGKTKKVKFGLFITNLLMKFGIDKRREIFKEILDSLGGKVRLFVAGAAAFDKEAEEGFNKFGIATFQGYGLTETSPVIAAEHPTVVKYGSIGQLFPSVQGKIWNPDKDGEGELVVKGDSVMLGYYGNEEATKAAFEGGWFHTGDLAYFDKDDYIFITGRQKSVIVLKNGKNIYPEELEGLINKIEGVKESFVYGKPENGDETDLKLNAKIVYDPEIMKEKYNVENEEEIKEILWKAVKEVNKGIPTYKYIKGITITTEELIKTTTQKIKRFEEIKRV